MIKEKIVQFPNRRRIKKLDANGSVIETFVAEVESDASLEGNIQEQGTAVTALLLNCLAYPVGSIYMSVNPVDPETLFGGKWKPYGQGRVLVGVGDNGETQYTASKQIGGNDNSVATHNHTIDEVSLVGHTTMDNTVMFLTGVASGICSVVETASGRRTPGNSSGTYTAGKLRVDASHDHDMQNAGASKGNRMPFMTCYMWERTA